jgi:hypothetical protein
MTYARNSYVTKKKTKLDLWRWVLALDASVDLELEQAALPPVEPEQVRIQTSS